MKLLSYIKKNGFNRTFAVFWQYKVDLLIQKAIMPFVKNRNLKNSIIIESHNDFDCNGGAFYNYLIEHGYNKKYRIIWLLKHPDKRPAMLPDNVECYGIYIPSFKKNYHICTARFFLADNVVTNKKRRNQKSFYLGHGTGGLKNVKGIITFNDSVDYILIQSPSYAPIQAKQYGLEDKLEKMVFLGYPVHDELLLNDRSEIKKVTDKQFKKIVMWMPTFRKCVSGGVYSRSDSSKEQKFGIPLIENEDEFNALNLKLKEMEMLLIIKIHPMQQFNTNLLRDLSNITILTGESVKVKNIDNYRLMRCTDALISDYSGVAYDYLQLNRPLGYVLDDMNDYKLGFVIDDIHTLLAGHEIFSLSDMYLFLKDVADGIDRYKKKREKIKNYIYLYNDTNNCKRLAEFMKL